ncbi:MAG: UbiA family prenyltransferase [Thermoplasmatota archaeon]
MGLARTVAEYLKLARSFNLALTAVGPVFGALAMGEGSLPRLLQLFIVGAGAHIYGFVLNDYIDMHIDSLSAELKDRPLVSGSVRPGAALALALSGLAVMLCAGYALVIGYPRAIIVLLIAAILATVYDLISKHLPGMDILVASAVFFLCAFGAVSVAKDILYVTRLAWIVCGLGGLQVLFMNIVAGGLKDLDHDSRGGGRTLAVALGCRVHGGRNALEIASPFRALAYAIQLLYLALLFSPFALGLLPTADWPLPNWILTALLAALASLSGAMLLVSARLLSQRRFVRNRMRKLIGAHYILNYSLVPVMLAALNPWILLLLPVPPLGFAISNLALAGEAMRPKTM